MFVLLDEDGNGQISFDEFCEARGHPLYYLPALIDWLIPKR